MKTHPLSVTHLVVGLVFLGVAGSWALREADVISAADVTWLIPVSLILAGGIGLIAAMAKGMTSRRKREAVTPSDSDYLPTYDAPLHPDYTSDLDRKLGEATTTRVAPTTTDTSASAGTDDTTRFDDIPVVDDTKDEHR